MTKFSANLGFLWSHLTLTDAIRAAASAGFDAVECHWPFETPAADVAAALNETGLKMLSLNTALGGAGDNGLSALPGRQAQARGAIDRALEYAAATRTAAVHVLAGNTNGEAAHHTFIQNLLYACARARPLGITVLIEPLNKYDAPGYFLQTTEQALRIIKDVDDALLKLLFDCYHVQIMEGDLTRRLDKCIAQIGHIQFASVPQRADPSKGEINYRHIFSHLEKLGYSAPLGAEYKSGRDVEATLGWMKW